MTGDQDDVQDGRYSRIKVARIKCHDHERRVFYLKLSDLEAVSAGTVNSAHHVVPRSLQISKVAKRSFSVEDTHKSHTVRTFPSSADA